MSVKTGKPVRLGLLGLGTVGSAVAEILHRDRSRLADRVGARLKIIRAAVRNVRRKQSAATRSIELTTDPAAVIGAPDVDIVVELAGGVDVPRRWILDAFAAGKPVVTANKAVIAAQGPKLHSASSNARAGLFYEGAVAGGIPIIRTLRDSLASDQIRGLHGVLNGTTNYILGEMEAGKSYPGALADAQRLGFAEADPTLDVSGGDAADKLAILLQLAYGLTVTRKKLPVEGIEKLTPEVLADAHRLGFRVKLLAVGKLTERREVEARVHPAFVRRGTPLSTIPGALNAVRVDSRNLGSTFYQGPGAGGFPTGNAVVADIIEAARGLRAGVMPPAPPSGSLVLADPSSSVSAYYLRFLVADRPGVLASIAQALADNGISLETVLQPSARGAGPVSVVVTTHACSRGAMLGALGALKRVRRTVKAVTAVRIELE